MDLNKIENEGKWSEHTTRLNSNFNKISQETESLKSTYRALTQSDVLVVSTLPQQGVANTIYRVVGNGSYSDYMYNSDDLTTPILMATYNNAIDLYPQEGSENLITSGAVYESYANQVYLDDQGEASIPDFNPQSDSVWSHGVQEISAVNQKQVRANLGFGNGDIDEVPVAGSDNLVKSGGAYLLNKSTALHYKLQGKENVIVKVDFDAIQNHSYTLIVSHKYSVASEAIDNTDYVFRFGYWSDENHSTFNSIFSVNKQYYQTRMKLFISGVIPNRYGHFEFRADESEEVNFYLIDNTNEDILTTQDSLRIANKLVDEAVSYLNSSIISISGTLPPNSSGAMHISPFPTKEGETYHVVIDNPNFPRDNYVGTSYILTMGYVNSVGAYVNQIQVKPNDSVNKEYSFVAGSNLSYIAIRANVGTIVNFNVTSENLAITLPDAESRIKDIESIVVNKIFIDGNVELGIEGGNLYRTIATPNQPCTIRVLNPDWARDNYTGVSYVFTAGYTDATGNHNMVTCLAANAVQPIYTFTPLTSDIYVFVRANVGEQVKCEIISSNIIEELSSNITDVKNSADKVRLDVGFSNMANKSGGLTYIASNYSESLFTFGKNQVLGKKVGAKPVISNIMNSVQGGACYENMLVMMNVGNQGEVAFVDLRYGNQIQRGVILKTTADYHNNQMFFGVEKFSESDAFPLLYISGHSTEIQVYRIVGTYGNYEFSLVQTITLPTTNTTYDLTNIPDVMIDYDTNHLYGFAYKNSIYPDTKNMRVVDLGEIPTLSQGDVTIQSVVSGWDINVNMWSYQAGIIDNGIMYMPYGDNNLAAIDLSTQQYQVITLPIYDTEPEHLFLYNGDLYITCCSDAGAVADSRITQIYYLEFVNQ